MDDRRLTRVQAASGATFALFVLLHLLNTAAAAGGDQAYDGFQRALRPAYQQPLLELLFVALPLGVHFGAAIVRLRRSGLRRAQETLRRRLHRLTGYYLLLVIIGHVVAVRGPSLLYDVYPGFAGLSYSIWWMPWFFYPYYLLLAFCGLFHALNGLQLAADAFGLAIPERLRSDAALWTPVLLGSAASLLAVLTIDGRLGPIADPTQSAFGKLLHDLVGAPLSR